MEQSRNLPHELTNALRKRNVIGFHGTPAAAAALLEVHEDPGLLGIHRDLQASAVPAPKGMGRLVRLILDGKSDGLS